MRVLVCGGRDYRDKRALYGYLSKLGGEIVIDAVIEGDGRGADRMAGFWARMQGIKNLKFPANWSRDGRAAGPLRNQLMLDVARPDLVVAFPGGRGTADMVRRAKAAGVRVVEVGHD